MTTDQKIEHLAGQVNCLMAFIAAAIASHNELGLLASEFLRLSESQRSTSLVITVSEQFLEGQHQCRTDIANLMREAIAKGA